MRTELTQRAAQGSIPFKIQFDPQDLRVKNTPFGAVVELADCVTTGEPGGPALPAKTVRIALPAFTHATGVEVKTEKPYLVSREPVMIAPVQLPRPGTKRSDDCEEEPQRDPRIKLSSLQPDTERFVDPLPNPEFVVPRVELYEASLKMRPAQLIATELHGMTPVAVVQINPVTLTKKGELGLYTEMNIEVFYEGNPNLVENTDNPDVDLTQLVNQMPRIINSRAQAERSQELTRLQVLNPDAVVEISRFWPLLLGDADYLMITDNQQWDANRIAPTGTLNGDLVAQFQRLADWKAKRGLKTRVVTVTNIVNGLYGNFRNNARDLQEVLRNFIKWAHREWGVAWLLLGGDINVIPVRSVAGASEGGVGREGNDPPNANKSFWTGTFLKMQMTNGLANTNNNLVRLDNGLAIPYDAAGTSSTTSRGWHFCTNNTYATRSNAPTNFVRVNGPAAEVNADMQWLYNDNMIPTDLYYGALFSLADFLPFFFGGTHDWDLNGNGVYGQHNNNQDFDFATYQPDISVGRAPVGSSAQAEAWINKVIAYEQFRRPDGTSLDINWPRRMIFGAENWGGRIGIGPTNTNPPGNNQYHHPANQPHSLIHLADLPGDLLWQLIVQVTENDLRLTPYDHNAAAAGRGWHYAISDTNLNPSGITINLIWMTVHFPIPTNWIVVYGPAAELTPQAYILDRDELDGSIADQETLRKQIAAQIPQINQISRYYSDEMDLPPADAAAAHLQHLTEANLRSGVDAGPHFVSLSGHGWWGGCCGFGLNTADNATNGYHSFIGYADSCQTNMFDVENAMSERVLYNPNGGAVAYVGNSRFSWIGVGDNFQRAFFNRLTATRHLGLLADSRGTMVNENTGFWRLYNKWVIFSLNLMGDPEMPVWRGSPNEMKVIYDKKLDKRQPFVVNVRLQLPFIDIPLANAAVHIQQGNFSRLALTNGAGQASFDIRAAQLGDLDVTVTLTGFRPHFGKAEVVGPVWVRGVVTEIYHQQGNTQQTLVRLRLSDNSTPAYYARKDKADYGIILDAVTDAYVSGKEISLEVNNHYSLQGVIDRFRFWTLVITSPVLEVVTNIGDAVLEPIEISAQPFAAVEAEAPIAEATGLTSSTNGQG